MKKIGYKQRDRIAHRTYSWKRAVGRFRRRGKFNTVNGGSGHKAGEAWGDAKDIDPNSPIRRYSKNSPSFDEGVYMSKKKRAMANKM